VPIRRVLALIWVAGAFAVMLWGWAFYAGPFRWAAEWQLEHFGSYEMRLTLFGPLIVLLIPAGLIGGWGPLAPPPARSPEARVANARRNGLVIATLGAVAIVAAAAAGGLGYMRMQTPFTSAELVLATGTEPAPASDLVKITGVARTDLIVRYEETINGMAKQWSFVPLVARSWQPADAIRFVLRTNQDAWMPPEGASLRTPLMLRRGSPPFVMTTQPSVLKHHALPGIVQTEYDKAHIPLDPSLVVVEQSSAEVYTPYWMTAALSGLVGYACFRVA